MNAKDLKSLRQAQRERDIAREQLCGRLRGKAIDTRPTIRQERRNTQRQLRRGQFD